MAKSESPKKKNNSRKPKNAPEYTPKHQYLPLLIPALITIVGLLIFELIFINQEIRLESEILLDSHHVTQGENSLRWQFEIQPTIGTRFFSSVSEVGCYIHIEVCPTSGDSVSGIDLDNFKEIIFSAKTNISTLLLNEFNIFINRDYTHYIYRKKHIPIKTVWKDYYINLDEFELARWDNQTNENRINDKMDGQNVMAFGLDLKTNYKPIKGKLWIDNVRLVTKSGQIILLSDCDKLESIFQGKKMRWISGANEYIIK